jgi:hypothetical protein
MTWSVCIVDTHINCVTPEVSNLLPTLFLVQTGLFINNEFVAGDSQIETINPANGKLIAKVEAGMFHHKSLKYMCFPLTPFFLMPVLLCT